MNDPLFHDANDDDTDGGVAPEVDVDDAAQTPFADSDRQQSSANVPDQRRPVTSASGRSIRIARGDLMLDDGDVNRISSELPGISDDNWTQFVRAMIVAPLSSVSDSNDLGMFAMPTRRLADLGIVSKTKRSKSPQGRTIWVAIFVPPLTSDKFLRSPQAQYQVFAKSMKDYSSKIDSGDIDRGGLPLSGALAILHRAGPNGIKTWSDGDRFPRTQASYDRVAGVF